MSKKSFQNGITCYQAGNYEEALLHFDEAVNLGGKNLYIIHDTRAAVYMKLGRRKEALKDAKKTIDIAPDRWRGYARAARVFFQYRKLDAAQTMINKAIERLKETETDRRASLLALEGEVRHAQEIEESQRKRFTDHMGMLPVELFGEIARIVVDEEHTALISLLHVSRNWRKVVETIPHLWGKLVLTKRRPKPKAKTWIERSNGRIKDLVIRDSAIFSSNWSNDCLEGLDWDHVFFLSIQQWELGTYLGQIGQGSLTRLMGINVDASTRMDGGRPLIGFLSGIQCDNLEHLVLDTVAVHVENLTGRHKKLKTCVFRDCRAWAGAWAELLAANPQLESLTMESIVPQTRQELVHLKFDHLTSLDLTKAVCIELYTAEMPQLRTLRLRSANCDCGEFLQHLLSTNVVHLTELRLHSCILNDVMPIISLLRISRDLQVFEITNAAAGISSIIEALASHYVPPPTSSNPLLRDDPPPVPSPIMCPKLTHVNFSGCPEVQTGPLLRLIKSRLPPAAPSSSELSVMEDVSGTEPVIEEPEIKRIESLTIDSCPNVDGQWLPKIRSVVAFVSCVYMTKKTRYRQA